MVALGPRLARGRDGGESVAPRRPEASAEGDVILLHDADHYSDAGCWRATAQALPRIVEAIRAAGLQPVGVD